MKSKSLILMVVSLGFGLIAAIGISQVMGNNKQAEPTVERAQVLVAAKSLKNGDDLTEENVKIEHWPIEVIPEDAARSFDQIQHMKISTRLGKSLPILLSDTISIKDYRTVEIPKGYKLVAIKVSAEDSFYGLLQPGDRVDVIGIVTVREQGARQARTKTVSETFLKNIEVYTVDGRLNSAPREGGNGKNSIVGILVTEKQSEMIALVQKVARLKLVMRGNHGEDENWEEFTDYSQFYESVFGKKQGESEDSGEESDVAVQPSSAIHNMRLYHGQQVQEVVFRGNQKMTPDSDLEESLEDSSDYDRQDDDTSDLEEDQYRGE